ncbi:MAG: hypothetical protein OEU26_24405, partial [Candidatus Tectomicrobia bacterium]|nr:hypothetical protein [Candidatus Tectomicrobia bacterium]
ALTALLADGNEYGGIQSHHEIIGAWAGDRIAIIGDYADLSHFSEDLASFTDISEHILQALCEDETLRTRLLRDREVAPPHPQPLPIRDANGSAGSGQRGGRRRGEPIHPQGEGHR